MKDLFLRYLVFFMALHVLNCSVDAPDAIYGHASENLAHNEQESIVELVVEKGLGFTDAIPEYDDTDEDNETPLKKNFSIDFCVLPSPPAVPAVFGSRYRAAVSKLPATVPHIGEIHCPPPEA